MTYTAKAAVCSEIRTKRSTQASTMQNFYCQTWWCVKKLLGFKWLIIKHNDINSCRKEVMRWMQEYFEDYSLEHQNFDECTVWQPDFLFRQLLDIQGRGCYIFLDRNFALAIICFKGNSLSAFTINLEQNFGNFHKLCKHNPVLIKIGHLCVTICTCFNTTRLSVVKFYQNRIMLQIKDVVEI